MHHEIRMTKITLGISSCLLGNCVRYDGGHKLDRLFTDTLGRYIDWVPVCPEAACGLGIPREAMALEGAPSSPRLRTVWNRKDHTTRMRRWIPGELKVLAEIGISGYVFKARSPSCGVTDTSVYDATSRVKSTGPGIFARAVMERFPLLPVEDEGKMHDPAYRENFIERVFAYQRWQEYIRKDGALAGLVSFHASHKYLLMAHSRKHSTLLGKMVAGAKKMKKAELFASYPAMLMEGLKVLATPGKNANVLQHMAGYFKDKLPADEKKELREAIESHRSGVVPLVVPATLLDHYIKKLKDPYLAQQHFLHPSPLELLLRNHA